MNTLYVVHSMGRCGSMSVMNAITGSARGMTLHVHRLRGPDADVEAVREIHRAWESEDWRVRAITLIREPVGRNLSAYFLNFVDRERRVPSVGDFLERYPHDVPLTWIPEQLTFWDCRFAEPLGSRPEPYIVAHSKTPVLFIRTQDLSYVWPRAWEEFTGQPAPSLNWVNSTSSIPQFRDLYAEFIREARLPRWYLDKMYQSDYARTFFSEAEIAQLYRIWS